jgi:tetratricopeptide (TPR) repeat protein
VNTPQDNRRYANPALLGEGASARVLSARDRWTGREVVLKVARAVGREGHGFLKEARLLRLLRSPVFPELVEFDPGDAQHPARLVLERRPGRPLSEGAALPPAEIPWVAAQLLQGLAELGRHGWIHGDLGPANLLLDGSRASLLDLGLARFLEQDQGARSGTPSVMPPEVLQHGLAHPRSDLFSLGALVFRLLAGHSPFPEDPREAVAAILAGRLRPAGEAATHPLFPLVLRCLQSDPLRRPEPLQALEQVLDLLPPARTALLLPRRGPGEWEPELLESVVENLATGGRVRLHAGGAGPWRSQLDQLALECAARGRPLLVVDRRPGETLLDWLARRVYDPARLDNYPSLARALEGRRGDGDLTRTLLAFLDEQVGRPGQGLVWLCNCQDPDEMLRGGLAALCARQGRALLEWRLDGVPGEDELHLETPGRAVWEAWLEQPATGIRLEPQAMRQVDRMVGGEVEQIPPAVARCLHEGRLVRRAGRWEWRGGEVESRRRPEDVPALGGELRRALLRACAWLEPAPVGAWRTHVLEGRRQALEELQGAGWLRDRGDGQLEAAAGVRDLLEPGSLAAEHLELLRELWRLGDAPRELCLLHLGRCRLEQVDPGLARQVLLDAQGLVDPERKARLAQELLPHLEPARRAEVEALLVSAWLSLGRLGEARRLLRRQVRRLPGQETPGLLGKLAWVYRNLGRPRLALRLLDMAVALSADPDERLALRMDCLDLLLRSGRAGEAAGRLTAALPEIGACDPARGSRCVHILNAAGAVAFQLQRVDEAAACWTRLDRAGRRHLQVQQRVMLANNLGILHLHAGRLEQARGELEQAGREAAHFHLERLELMARVNLALAQLRRGAADQAVRELEPALRQARDLDEPDTELAVLDTLGEAWAALGDLEAAERSWLEELERARHLGRPHDEADPLTQLLRLEGDLGLPFTPAWRERLGQLDHGLPAARQWRLLGQLEAGLIPERGSAPEDGWALEPPRTLRLQVAGRQSDRSELLGDLLGLEPRLDGVRLALGMLENRLAWLADWAPQLREERESHRLHQLRLLGLEGELAARREDWLTAGQRLGRAVRQLHELARDLSPAWQERLAASPWLTRLVERAEQCHHHLLELERSEHGPVAGTAGRAAGA